VLISKYLEADASTRLRYLKLFNRKNIYFIIVPGLILELNRIPAGEKAKFMHEVSFLDKDAKEQQAKAAEADNPVYDYAGAEPVGESLITEAKREVRRYFIRPQNIFCANKAEIIKALIDIGDQNCSVYTLKYLGPEKDINKLTNKDIIYYYDNEILYDKNHVKVMDYDLYIKHEEERQKFSGDIEDVPEDKFNDEYEDRIHQDTVLEDFRDAEDFSYNKQTEEYYKLHGCYYVGTDRADASSWIIGYTGTDWYVTLFKGKYYDDYSVYVIVTAIDDEKVLVCKGVPKKDFLEKKLVVENLEKEDDFFVLTKDKIFLENKQNLFENNFVFPIVCDGFKCGFIFLLTDKNLSGEEVKNIILLKKFLSNLLRF
jgi:hypothetical protein